MKWITTYLKDPKAVGTMIFIVAFLIVFVMFEPQWWYWALLALIAYIVLFYAMRNNP
jgi:uncharacterized membrane protein YjjB (DUF3815 family)